MVLTRIVHVTHRIHHRRLAVAIRHAHRIFPALHTAILRKLALVVGVVRTHPDLRLIQQQRQRIRIQLLAPAVRRMTITTVQTQAHYQIPHKFRMHLIPLHTPIATRHTLKVPIYLDVDVVYEHRNKTLTLTIMTRNQRRQLTQLVYRQLPQPQM